MQTALEFYNMPLILAQWVQAFGPLDICVSLAADPLAATFSGKTFQVSSSDPEEIVSKLIGETHTVALFAAEALGSYSGPDSTARMRPLARQSASGTDFLRGVARCAQRMNLPPRSLARWTGSRRR